MSQPSKGAVGGHDLSDIICPELVKSLLVIIIVEYLLREVEKTDIFTVRLTVRVDPPPPPYSQLFVIFFGVSKKQVFFNINNIFITPVN